MDFNLERTLTCGQYFLWRRDGDAFVVQSRDVRARVRQFDGALEIEGADPAWATHLFALDHPDVATELASDERLRPALEKFRGLRIMRQDPWECLLGFMLSTCSNIPRIQRQLWTLAGDGAVPRPQARPDLAPLRAGYRAEYLAEAYRCVDEAWLDSIRTLDDDPARAKLMTLPGVGRKVANCVLLYAYERHRAFPVDVWVRRAMKRLSRRRRPDEKFEAMAGRRWGRWAGYAQQFLYASARDGG